jgi:hypothetical protein
MKLKAVLTIAAIYQAIIGLGMILVRIFGGPMVGMPS